MGKEIERKFLVDKKSWEDFKKKNNLAPVAIKQAYLQTEDKITSRIRTKSEKDYAKAYLTIKGKTEGISRAEFEYEIPFDDAEEMISLFCKKSIFKERYTFDFKGKTWELDEFSNPNPDLILAEIELETENEPFAIPIFIKNEVSSDPQYYNVNMLKA